MRNISLFCLNHPLTSSFDPQFCFNETAILLIRVKDVKARNHYLLASNYYSKMSELIENKKWIVDRIEHMLDAYSRGIETNRQRFEKNAEDHLSSKKSNRDQILTGLGIVISITFGVSAWVPSEQRQIVLIFLFLLALPLGLIFFWRQARVIRWMSEEYLKIEETYLKGITFTSAMRAVLVVKTLDLKIEPQDLEVLSDYFRMVEAGVVLDIIIKTFEATEKNILNEANYFSLIYQAVIRYPYELYENYRDGTSSKANSLKSIREQHKDLFDEFNEYVELLRDEGIRQRIFEKMEISRKDSAHKSNFLP